MKLSLLPKSQNGKWAVGLTIFFLTVGIFFYIFAELLNIITSDLLITLFGATIVIASVIASIIGIVSVVKSKERSVMVFLAIFIGLVVLGMIIGNF